MYIENLVNKLQKLIDKLPIGEDKDSVKEDLRLLKASESDYLYITLANKYNKH